MLCLGIESSCDETALALVRDGTLVDSVLATQVDMHALFGGVVPELASREHYRFIGPLFDALMERNACTLHDINAIAVARGPGLLGSLLVGVAFAKGLALAINVPIVGVNHLHAHLLAAGLEQNLIFPCIGLLVSGGHTHLYHMADPVHIELLGRTLDDAAGEAFDKVGKVLQLPYPAGKLLDSLARRGKANAKLFPRPYTDNDTLDFSFSGLKTAFMQYLDKNPELYTLVPTPKDTLNDAPQALCDVCASFNLAVVDTLRIKTAKAFRAYPQVQHLIVAGGVAANSLLRENLTKFMHSRGGTCVLPSPALCTDNAAMIAYAGSLLAAQGYAHSLHFEAIPRGRILPDDLHVRACSL
ncbi:MAG: tRNA (adenosine(37)-N6)-threonylcarbamoyltransferase complex transferase subunit TsaD [Desulfovibrionaceae bacterium]